MSDVKVPAGFKVRASEKRSAQAMIRRLEAEGAPVNEKIRVVAAAPVKSRSLTPAQQVEEIENAVASLRAEFAKSDDETFAHGVTLACDRVIAAMRGELS